MGSDGWKFARGASREREHIIKWLRSDEGARAIADSPYWDSGKAGLWARRVAQVLEEGHDRRPGMEARRG